MTFADKIGSDTVQEVTLVRENAMVALVTTRTLNRYLVRGENDKQVKYHLRVKCTVKEFLNTLHNGKVDFPFGFAAKRFWRYTGKVHYL